MKFVPVCSVFIISALLPSHAAPNEPSVALSPKFTVEWHDKLLDVKAEDISINDLMVSIAEKTGLEIRGKEYLKGNVHADFTRQTLPEALKTLLPQANYLLQESSGPQQTHPVITLISDTSPSSTKTKLAKPALAKPIRIPPSAGYVPEQYHKLYSYAQNGDIKALQQAIANGETAAQVIATKLLAEKEPVLAAELATQMAKSSDPNRRLNAIQSLSEINNNDAAKALGVALQDPAYSVRNAAVLGLHNQTSTTAVTFLTQALQDEDAAIRLLALDLLAEKGTDGVAGIHEAMASNDPRLREHAQELLQQISPGE